MGQCITAERALPATTSPVGNNGLVRRPTSDSNGSGYLNGDRRRAVQPVIKAQPDGTPVKPSTKNINPEVRNNFPLGEVFEFASHVDLYLAYCHRHGFEPSDEELKYQSENDDAMQDVFDSETKSLRRNPRSWVELFLVFSLRAQNVVLEADHHREVYSDLDRLARYICCSAKMIRYRDALKAKPLGNVRETLDAHYDQVLPDGTRMIFAAPDLESLREELREEMDNDHVLQFIRDGRGTTEDKEILQNNWKLDRLGKTLFMPWNDIVNEYK